MENSEDFHPKTNANSSPDLTSTIHDAWPVGKQAPANAAGSPGSPGTLDSAAAKELNKGALPNMDIAGAAAQESAKNGDGDKSVGSDLLQGALNQVVDHPIQTVGDIALGAGLAVGVPIMLAALPVEGAVAGSIALLSATAFGLYELGSTAYDAANVLDAPNNFSADQITKAHKDMQDVGGDIVQIAAGVAGGGYAGVKVVNLASSFRMPWV